MSPMNNRLLRPTSNYDSDALRYINAVQFVDGQALEPEVRTAIDAFVRGCKADDSGVVAGRSNWDAIQACCIMAGARTISGALVPLKTTYGAELVDINNLPTPTISNAGGSVGVWTAATRTMSNTPVGTNAAYPRFQFPISATVGRRYRVTLVLSGDITGVNVRLGLSGGLVAVNASTGVVDAIMTCTTQHIEFHLNGTLAPQATRIESLSIREDSFTPTAQGGWTSSEYSRGGSTPGLKGNGSTLYLDSNRANNADPQNDNHMAFYATQQDSGTAVACMGAGPTTVETGATNIGIPASSAQTTFRSRSSTADNKAANCVGFVGTSRADSAAFSARANGTAFDITRASQAPTSDGIAVFSATGGAYKSNARISYYSIGSACDLAALDARVSTLMAAIQAFLP